MFDLNAIMSFLLALGAAIGWSTVARVVIGVVRFVWGKWFQRPTPQPPTVIILLQLVKTIAEGGSHNQGTKSERRKSRRRRRFRP